MSNFQQFIDYLFSFSSNDRGKIFELYCKWFLENDPRYSSQLKKVWLWRDWPENWGRDKGIDLIAETHSGEIWAIQAKAYDEKIYITKEDIDKFLSESSRKIISFRLLIATTNNIGPNALEAINGQEKQVSLCRLNNLEESILEWPISFDQLNPVIKKSSKVPKPHQEKAIKDILSGFEKSNIGQVHMACGTGKTLVGLWVTKELKCHNTLVLVPSISLVSQLYHDWSENRNDFVFDPIFICSDDTVADKDDQLVINKAELGFPITTNAQELVDQLTKNSHSKVVFATYHSSPVIKEACEINPNLIFDLTIADKAHRCSGSAKSGFATIVDKSAIKTIRKLFMTATPKIFSEHVKQKTKEIEYEIASMDDETKFGPVFHKLTFSDAIKENLLSDYRVLISVMDNETYREYAEKGRLINIENFETDARTLASQILIAKAIKKLELKKIITFHNKQKAAKDFINTFKNAMSLLSDEDRPEISYTNSIFGEMPQSERSKVLKIFKQETETGASILANVKCLSEGVDVPEIDCVAFIDPKGSEIDIVQAVGRAIRNPKSSDKKISTIIIPIFVDSKSDETQDLEQSCFKPIWQVVRALRSHDDVLAEELDNIRLELGKRTYKKPPKLTKIIFDVPTSITTDFNNSIKIKVVESCSVITLDKSHPELVKEWHPTKNESLKPSNLTAGSGKKIWWKCPQGLDHEWQSTVANRVAGTGCGVCAGKLIVKSNCLNTTHPELAKEWHPNKNENLTPYDVTRGSHKKVWWRCLKITDHEWQTSIKLRVNGTGCSICNGKLVIKANCLNKTHPELSKEWHPTKNENLTPDDVIAGSNKKVWWKCIKNHEWQASVWDRSKKNYRCPFCSGNKTSLEKSLLLKHPNISNEWHPVKNEKLTPSDVTSGSRRKIWWQCANGHEWQAVVYDRTKKNYGCRICKKNNKINVNSGS